MHSAVCTEKVARHNMKNRRHGDDQLSLVHYTAQRRTSRRNLLVAPPSVLNYTGN